MSDTDTTSFLRRRRTWLIGIPVVVLLAVVGGPFVYINFIKDDPPERLTLEDRTTSTTAADSSSTPTSDDPVAAADGIDGEWTVAAEGNQAGYRVKEVLFGQDTEGVGRTTDVTGSLRANGTSIEVVEIEVDMTTIESDESRRDGQFDGRIMSVDQFPTATFELSSPVDLGELPAEGETVSVEITGALTLRGVTQMETFTLDAVLEGGQIVVNGTIEVDFDAYEIPDASGGPASVGRTGELEFLVVFER